jgi:hypothetical protein
MAQITTGLKICKFGDLITAETAGKTGALKYIPDVATGMVQLGLTNEGSSTFDQAEPETTSFFAEEIDQPVDESSKLGEITYTFELMNPDLDAISELFGGSITYSSGAVAGAVDENAVIGISGTFEKVEKSVYLEPKQGFKNIVIPRASIKARFNGAMQKAGLFMLTVVVTPLQLTLANGTALDIVYITGKSEKPA